MGAHLARTIEEVVGLVRFSLNVIDNHDPDSAGVSHIDEPPRHKLRRVPQPAALSNVSLAPIDWARSRMTSKPK